MGGLSDAAGLVASMLVSEHKLNIRAEFGVQSCSVLGVVVNTCDIPLQLVSWQGQVTSHHPVPCINM